MRTQIPGKQILDSGVETADIKDRAVTDVKLSTTGVSPGSFTKVTVNAEGRVTGASNPTTLAGYGITDAVSSTAAAAFPVILSAASPNFASGKVLKGTTNQVDLTTVGGDIVLSLAQNAVFPGTASITLPVGSTAQRGSAVGGRLRYNSDTGALEAVYSSNWERLATLRDITEDHVLRVSKDPQIGQFGSIADAVAHINQLNDGALWLIEISPGQYVEPTITIPEWTQVSGLTEYGTYVIPAGTTDPVFVLGPNTGVSWLNVTGATGAEQPAFLVDNTSGGTTVDVLLHKVAVLDCPVGWEVKGTAGEVNLYLEYCCARQTGPDTYGIRARGDNGHDVYVHAENFYVHAIGSDNPYHAIDLAGENLFMNLQTFGLEGHIGKTTGHGIHVANGARLEAKAGSIFGWNIGVHLENTGVAQKVNLLGVALHDNTTWDLKTDHPGALGSLTGSARRTKVDASGSPNFTFAYADVENNGFIQTGDFYLGSTASTVTNATALLIETPPMGLISGGVLSGMGGLDVNVGSGSGYLRNNGNVQFTTWANTDLTLSPNTTPYIYVNAAGQVLTSATEPDGLTNIILGRAGTNSTLVYSLGSLAVNTVSHGNKIENYLRQAVGTVYVSGSIVTENATTPRAIDITAGRWMYGTMVRNPSAKTAPTIQDVHRTNGTVVYTPTTTVPNATYDNGTNLVPVTSGYFTKHALYQSSEGAYQTVILGHAQAQYATLEEALAAPLPTPLISQDSTPRIAALVMQEGVDSIVEIIDIRPMFFREGGVSMSGGGVIDHGDLLGLHDDDHPQYLAVSGTRSMVGDLNMGGNDITNVATVDGVDVSLHAARHQPNGADPLATGPAVSLSTTTINSAGTSNLLSRADHTHALDDVQPASTELTALANINTNGILVHTDPDTWETRTVTSSTNTLNITNGDGVSGNIDINLTTTAVAGTYRTVTTDAYGRVTAGSSNVPWSAITGTPTTVAGYGIVLDPDLQALANSSSSGFYIRTGDGTSVTRSLVAPAAGITIENPDGVSNAPTFALANDLAALEALSTTGLAVRTATDTWAARTLVAPAAGLTISNPLTGNITFALANDLAAVEAQATPGIAVRTSTGATSTWAIRTLTSSTLNLTNPAGIAGDPTINLSTVGSAGTYRSVTTDAYGRVTAGTNPTTLAGYGITDAIPASEKGAANGVATLGADGKLPVAQLPALAITDSFVVANEAAMLGLSAEVGDIAIRSDLSKTFILQALPATDIANWKELATPTDTVTSVNGQTGAVSLDFVTSVGATAPAAGLTISGSPITSSGSFTFGLANDLAALEGLSSTGFAVRTAADTWTQRSIAAGTGIGVSNGDGVAGAPTISLATVGTAGTYRSVTTDAYGRVTAGTNPTTLAGYGITDAQPLDSDLTALANTSTTGLYVVTGSGTSATRSIVAGAGISVTNGSGTAGNITISSTATGTVTSVGLSAPSFLTVSGSPITSSGTLALGLATQTANTVLAGPASGPAAAPTFRTLGLGELGNVTLTSPTANQVLSYNGTAWVNSSTQGASATGAIGAAPAGGGTAWTLLSGTRYYADFVHNLGTTNVVITVYDNATNAIVIPDEVVVTNNNSIRVTVIGNTRTLKVVVVANGTSIMQAGATTASSVVTSQNGVTVVPASTKLNFQGAVAVTDAGSNVTNISVGARYTFFANTFDTPNNSDWAVNAFAPAMPDATSPALPIRSFSSTIEQGVGVLVTVPPGATSVTFRIRGRSAAVTSGTPSVVMRLYSRAIPNAGTMGAWSTGTDIATIAMPASTNFVFQTVSVPLASAGLTAGTTYQFELTRKVSGVSGNLPAAFNLFEVTLDFI